MRMTSVLGCLSAAEDCVMTDPQAAVAVQQQPAHGTIQPELQHQPPRARRRQWAAAPPRLSVDDVCRYFALRGGLQHPGAASDGGDWLQTPGLRLAVHPDL